MTIFDDWLDISEPGQRFVYGVDDGKKRPGPSALRETRNAADAGLVVTIQRRRTDGGMDYIAERRAAAAPKPPAMPARASRYAVADHRRARVMAMVAEGSSYGDCAAELSISRARVCQIQRSYVDGRHRQKSERVCAVPFCGVLLTKQNTCGVCRAHVHAFDHCGCNFCVSRRAAG